MAHNPKPARDPDASGFLASVVDPDSIALLTAAIDPIAFPDDARARMRSRLLAETHPDYTIVRRPTVEFVPLSSGIDIAVLRRDPSQRNQTTLFRMAAGATLPDHRHIGEEECYVLDGAIRFGDVVLASGDYVRVRPGALHAPIVAPSGALLLIRSDLVIGFPLAAAMASERR